MESWKIRLKEWVEKNGVANRFGDWGKIDELEGLYLYKITEIPPEIGNLVNLTQLGLISGKITEIPPEIGNLVNLTALSLSYNEITEIPPEIENLINLERLDLFENKITELPPEIGNLVNLTKLNLDKNKITELPPEIGNLVNLETIWSKDDNIEFEKFPNETTREFCLRAGYKLPKPKPLKLPKPKDSNYKKAIEFCDFILNNILETEFFYKKEIQLSKNSLGDIQLSNPELQKIQTFILEQQNFKFGNLKNRITKFKNHFQEIVKNKNLEKERETALDFIENGESVDFSNSFPELNLELFQNGVIEIYNRELAKISKFSDEISFFEKLSNEAKLIFETSKYFESEQREALRLQCEDSRVSENFDTIFTEWAIKIEKIETLYFPIIEAYFQDRVSENTVFELFKIFANYRKSIDLFFIEDRISLVQKYDENPKSEYIQKVVTEKELLNHCSNFRDNIYELLEKENNFETKKLLGSQSEIISNGQIETISQISTELNFKDRDKNEFDKLEKMVSEIQVSDTIQYGLELKKLDKSMLNLIFKMKKDLEKKGKV